MTDNISYLPQPGHVHDHPAAQRSPFRCDLVELHQWRVIDQRLDEGSGHAVVGFIQEVAGVFEVTHLESPESPEFCESLPAALAWFSAD